MHRKAYNSVTYKNHRYIQAVVEFDDEGKVERVYEFRDELPFTEWVGGDIEI